MDADAILTAVEECLLGTIGSVRTVASGTFARRAYEGLDLTLAARAMETPRFEVELRSIERTGAIGPRSASVSVEEVEVLCRFVFSTDHELQDAERTSKRAEAAEKILTARRALEWPGNLTQTAAAAPTGLVSGCLTADTGATVKREDWKRRLYVVEMPMIGLVRSAQAVS